MQVLIVDHQEVRQWLPMGECMDVMAETHLEAMRIARQITGLRVWSQQFDHAQKFADQASAGLLNMI
jgi:hypothetical protein